MTTSIYDVLTPTNQPVAATVNATDTVTLDQGGVLVQGTISQLGAYFSGTPITENLIQWVMAESFQMPTANRNQYGAITTATILWPDGGIGAFVTDTASTAFPGAIDAWHATYVNGAVSHVITQPIVTRDGSGGVVIQPTLIIT